MAHRIQLIAILLAAGLVGLSACGLDVVGVAPEDAGAGSFIDAAPPAAEAGLDARPPDACPASCPALAGASPELEPVLFGDGACPAGFDATATIEDPIAAADSCTCGDCNAKGANCLAATFKTKSGDSVCDGASGVTFYTGGGACRDVSLSFGSNKSSLVLDPAVPGTCAPDATAARDKIATTKHRLCRRGAGACANAVCTAAPALALCFASPGSVACPTGMSRHLVGSDLEAKCEPCDCTATATCNATAVFYDLAGCGGAVKATVTTACGDVNNATFNSLKFTPAATEGCAGVRPRGPAKTTLRAMTTVCCPK